MYILRVVTETEFDTITAFYGPYETDREAVRAGHMFDKIAHINAYVELVYGKLHIV